VSQDQQYRPGGIVTNSPTLPASVTRDQLTTAIRALGLDPDQVSELHLFPTYLMACHYVPVTHVAASHFMTVTETEGGPA
jgi:hypothetical protein